ncbi:nuclear transport factor 2 family protein [Xanthobacter autotrophicus]|uniref:ester cyclase n=1 Tax=Xanthobacter TaxID=279 RepID=UPI0024AC491E|nr:ester cyclase [Xanthobacter autotrophicus]MDI4663181.1 nuclear transport factor 2 family protein [Xanthobacter autotrophicus]
MALTPEVMDRKIEEHFGFEARDDIDGVLSTLAPDCEHDVVGWPDGPSVGHAQARKFYEALFADLADSRTECVRRLYGEHFLIDETRWSGRAVGKPFGLEGGGRALSFRMLHVLEFTEAGDIRREQVWLDFGAILKQLG